MKKYQIVESYGTHMHAGSKANNDCVNILEELGFEKIEIVRHKPEDKSPVSKIIRQLSFYKQWNKVLNKLSEGDVLLLQHPYRRNHFGRTPSLLKLKKKKVKIISLVHDVELIRGIYDDPFYQKEFDEMLSFADSIIVHNEEMKDWFVKYGVDEKGLVVLEIFDYLNDKSVSSSIEYSKTVTVAGNLSPDKSPYLYQLDKVPSIRFQLMGIGYHPIEDVSNVSYLGAFAPEEVPNHLNGGFGLVWDGESLDTCDGVTGNYLRYNNPHKLSLYLSSGLPVIVWKDSAEANFVEKNGVGLAVNSLFELSERLERLTQDEYLQLVTNTKNIMTKLKEGYYLKSAVNKIIE